ncbi:putative G patch domain and KOW motifs-containing protein [Hypsibius exemplaris]|uniref:G patch domain and KOW motifs-containing protein n=1 Tax=Hypsibius exemplaris TaxID=2072580 RepID=A0A9X6NGD3_HYPEX|nr:putative G patch domain and KOW motifs-containing protein [Hypsibius exemplaris]
MTVNRSAINLTLSKNVTINQPAPQTPIWDVTPIFLVIVCILGLAFNATAMFLFVVNRRRSGTPFDNYAICLFGANLVSLAVQYPMQIINNLYTSGWIMSDAACTLLLYCISILSSLIIHIHAIMAINRAWAIVYPLSYRNWHTQRLTRIVCVALLMYIHVAEGSFWLTESLHYRLDIRTQGCIFNTKAVATWSNVTDIVLYITPLCVVLISFPIVMVNKGLRARTRPGRLTHRQRANVVLNRGIAHDITPQTAGKVRSDGQLDTAGSVRPLPNMSGPSGNAQGISGGHRGQKMTNKYLLLALLTGSVAVFMVPYMVYFLLMGFVDSFWNQTYFQVAGMLYTCQTVVDPIVFVLTLDKLHYLEIAFEMEEPSETPEDASGNSTGVKVKFGFAKKSETKIQISSTNRAIRSEVVEVSRSVEFITTVEDLAIVSQNGGASSGETELVIPLIRRNKWAAKPSFIKNAAVLNTEDAAAAAEILKDVEKLQNGVEEGDDSSLEIPLWMQNRLPEHLQSSETGTLNSDMHASEPTQDDYDQIPVEKYGMAMLRGMGWREDQGIGKTNKQVTKAMEINIRPRGLGLGAVPVKEKKKQMEKDAEEKAEKKITKGSFVRITQGRDEGRIGKVTDSDPASERWTVQLVGEEKRLVHLLEVNLTEISEKEYKKAGVYLNQDAYHRHKIIQDDKLALVRQDVLRREDERRARRKERESVKVKREDSSNEEDGEPVVWAEAPEKKNSSLREERKSERDDDRGERKRDGGSGRSEQRRKRSRTRSRSPDRRRRK